MRRQVVDKDVRSLHLTMEDAVVCGEWRMCVIVVILTVVMLSE